MADVAHEVTVADLIAALSELPTSLPIALCVNGHSWYSPCHTVSHGAPKLEQMTLTGSTQITVVMIRIGALPWTETLHAAPREPNT